MGRKAARLGAVHPHVRAAAELARCAGNGHVVEPSASPPANALGVQARPLDRGVVDATLMRVDLIKIDMKGFEWPVLQGAEETLVRFRSHVVIECNAVYAARGGGGAPGIAEFFRRYRYWLFAVYRNWVELIEDRSWPGCVEIWAVSAAGSE